jgi:hypothetical protein
MVARSTAALLLAFFLGPCHHLSFTERRVVGTWQHNSMDAIMYYVFYPDHRFELVGDDGTPQEKLVLIAEGKWKIDSVDVTIESSVHAPAGYIPKDPRPPRTDRIPLHDLFTVFHSHRSVSYTN